MSEKSWSFIFWNVWSKAARMRTSHCSSKSMLTFRNLGKSWIKIKRRGRVKTIPFFLFSCRQCPIPTWGFIIIPVSWQRGRIEIRYKKWERVRDRGCYKKVVKEIGNKEKIKTRKIRKIETCSGKMKRKRDRKEQRVHRIET